MTKARDLRADFLLWQCRLRQMAMREDGGRPSPGMRADIQDAEGRPIAQGILTLIHKAAPAETTALFRHQALKTQDPIERWQKAVEHMAAGYFQQAESFGENPTALFAATHPLYRRLAEANLAGADRVRLDFLEFGQGFRLSARVRELAPEDALYAATYWHNRLFNPHLPERIGILAFHPDWGKSTIIDPA